MPMAMSFWAKQSEVEESRTMLVEQGKEVIIAYAKFEISRQAQNDKHSHNELDKRLLLVENRQNKDG